MSTAKALRRALARTADDLWALSLVCTEVGIETLDQDGVVDALDDGCLLLVLDGPDGATGIAQIDRAALAGVTEIQTIQTVTYMPVDQRPLTHTDAPMVAPLLDDALTRFAQNLQDDPLCPQIQGFRFGAMIEDRRGATLLLEASEYRAFHATLDLEGGTRTGVLSLLLPIRDLQDDTGDHPAKEDAPHSETLQEVPARLDCVLARVRLPLSKAEALRPGDLVPLSAQALDGVELVASGGMSVAGGRLGQMNGARAVRLAWPRRGLPTETALAAAAGSAALAAGDAATPDGMLDLSPEPAAPMGDFDFDMAEPAAAAVTLPDLPPMAPDDGAGDLPDLPPLEPMGDSLPDLPPLEPEPGDDPLAAFGGPGDAAPAFEFDAASADFDVET